MSCPILVDVRERRSGVPAELKALGLVLDERQRVHDYAWDGITIERKTWTDLLNSMNETDPSLRLPNGKAAMKVVRQLVRSSGQVWLVVEGTVKVGPDGYIEGRKRTMASVRGFLFRLRTKGVQVEYTADAADTARFIADLYRKSHESSAIWPV